MYILQLIDFPHFLLADETLYAVSKRIYIYKIPYTAIFRLETEWYCANVCGCRETGWRDPTGFLTNIYLISYIVIFDCYHG